MRLLSFNELKAAKGVPYAKQHIYRLMASGEFPRSVQLSANRVAWLESEIDSWINERVDARDRVAA
ncbi:AlpA family phage regulatory protein [Rhizobium brockwellii]|uniref:AlpA family phage regulatory protein n=1 Tax=Rhizobium brockwellii TaxID=3019932 RepID=A0ABU3YEM3_9HYPH|nr:MULTISPECIES: AlpA family phage regulatory protein [Rhizobium]MBY5777780.1 AlpA family phage regulatory protein [Rhizobium leguminosarum]MDV4177309.1 AlpA family phage regulatory protein [Rhizobium brockwellii]MDV4184308.1 AlpA family phage regulatory protein [Rhizobium brockwellii]NEI61405.1 AlpA family phage regulatory protein [Rhizobium leguminosarum]NEJ82001.1 AlpA family phage regulatory protein [Rhizobium leguminosarum]